MTDRFDDDGPQPSPTEGVRILGAEEAQAALDAGTARATDDSEPEASDGTDGSAPRADSADPHHPGRFPTEGPSWSAADATDAPTGEVPALPHWTEPPTGAVPAIFADDSDAGDEGDEDLDAWASLGGSQPRFRAEGADWAEADFAEGELTDDSVRVGALAETAVDDDTAFEREVQARRRKRPAPRRAPSATAPAPPAPRRNQPFTETRPAGSSGRDLPTALATAAILTAIALVCFKWGSGPTAVLAAVVVAAAALEFCNGLQNKGFRPATLLATLGSGLLVLAARNFGDAAYPVVFFVLVVFTFLWFLLEITPGRPTLGVATTVLAFAYVGGLGAFSGLLLQTNHTGVRLLLGVLICVIASDVVGFFVGSQWGRTPIVPKISPHKSVQGTVAGMIASLLFGWEVVGHIHPWTPSRGALLGALIALGAFLGDLSESIIKRDLGIKDFGTVLPGHGGVLDRFDALLFCLPIGYYLALHFHLV